MNTLLTELYESGYWINDQRRISESIPVDGWACICCGGEAEKLVRFEDNPSWVGYCKKHLPNL